MKKQSNNFKDLRIMISLSGVLLAWLLLPIEMSGQLQLRETNVTIPTYKNSPPNPMPRFYEGRGHQGVQKRIYPYPYDDGQSNILSDEKYHIIEVENDYINLGIMPLMGGRIYYAYDKTNNYNWFYHNHVVKPSMIGMVGNWVSGSNAWGYPHHHGPHTVEAMDYKIETHPDGSKTVWINSTDRLHRVNALVGYTTYPNSSIVEMTIHPRNRTAITNSFLFWANPAVHCDSNYQVIFPPSVQYITHHAKRELTTWPIASDRYGGYDFTGLDISWWKNTRVPSSFFSWDPREDYFGGYDHNLQAGTAWIGNHHVSPGMKYWADGNNANGLNTNNGLTDNDGRYIEMMAGFFTDNQPDYSWLQPYETKLGTMIWFPIRELGGIKYANRNGAMNYELKGRNLEIRLNTTTKRDNARIVLKVKGNEAFSKVMNISPASPQKVSTQVPAGTIEDDLDILFYDANSELILDFRPIEHHPPKYDKPEPYKAPGKPEEMKSVEELYLAGLRLDQFHNTSDPMPYYMEALKRDPGDFRTNTQLGIKNIKGHKWNEAEKYLRTAVERVTNNYTRARDGEPEYYLGIVLRLLERPDEAYDVLYRAAWSSAWHTAAYLQLAEIDCERGHFDIALDHLNRSISTNVDNIRSQNLKAAVLRKLNDKEGAQKLLTAVLESSKINHMALNELYLIESQLGNSSKASAYLTELNRIMRDEVQSYLELGTEYANAGLYQEAFDALSRLEKKGNNFPMLYYYLGYYSAKTGNNAQALSYYEKANKMPHDYCFPFRSEELTILRHAMTTNPKDAMAPYYLGNLFYENYPEQAIALWEKSRGLDDKFYITHRNLGLAYSDIQKDYIKAVESMKKAVECGNDDARLLVEIDAINEFNKVSPEEKYKLFTNNKAAAEKRSDALIRFVVRAIEFGKYDEALNILDTKNIFESEGSVDIQNAYLNCYMLKSLALMDKSQTNEALVQLQKALDYPIGLYGSSRYAQIYYLNGLAYKNGGNSAKAKEFFEKAAVVSTEERGDNREYDFYKGLALVELNKSDEAKSIFQKMLGNDDGNAASSQFGGRGSLESRRATSYYVAGLGYKGLGDKTKAKEQFNEALKINPSHLWARVHLNSF